MNIASPVRMVRSFCTLNTELLEKRRRRNREQRTKKATKCGIDSVQYVSRQQAFVEIA